MDVQQCCAVADPIEAQTCAFLGRWCANTGASRDAGVAGERACLLFCMCSIFQSFLILRMTRHCCLQLASATLGLAFFLASNAIVVSELTCHAASTRRIIYWFAFARWTCWNTTFLVTTVKVWRLFSPSSCANRNAFSLRIM